MFALSACSSIPRVFFVVTDLLRRQSVGCNQSQTGPQRVWQDGADLTDKQLVFYRCRRRRYRRCCCRSVVVARPCRCYFGCRGVKKIMFAICRTEFPQSGISPGRATRLTRISSQIRRLLEKNTSERRTVKWMFPRASWNGHQRFYIVRTGL